MTNDETMEQDITPEETQIDATESVDNTPTVEDYERLQKELKTVKAQKEHYKKKATAQVDTNKQNNQSGLSREEVILFAQGKTEEEVDLALKIAKINGISPLKATEDEYFRTVVEKRLQKEQSEKAALPASRGSGVNPPKPVGEMTREEHEEYFRKVIG